MTEEYCPRLIEVALPIREISAESVRDKSLRHGHVSTLHLWWARRPLAASRAVVFASLAPDPDDVRCPEAFKNKVEQLLKTEVPAGLKHYRRHRDVIPDPDPYKPYDGLPDTPRNRLLTFIAKWSSEALAFEKGKSRTPPKTKELLDDRSLIKWETGDPGNPQGREVLKVARELIKTAHNGRAPTVLDPFAGGGSIPLEAGRLGCRAIANDYNPVAYLILRATCEFPQKYGKPGKRKVSVEEFGKVVEKEIEVPNVLAHDVETWANRVLERARKEIGHLYPPGKDEKPVVGYFWARTAPCSNPSCRGEMPLLRSLLVCNKQNKKVALTMEVDKGKREVSFDVAEGGKIKDTGGTMQNRGNARCPYCEQVTPVSDLRKAGLESRMGERMVCVIVQGENGKEYRPVEISDLEAYTKAESIDAERPSELILPEINAQDAEDNISNSTGIRVHLYGMKTWGSLFNNRQLVVLQTLVGKIYEAIYLMKNEISDDQYLNALGIYMSFIVSKVAQRLSNVGIWDTGFEKINHPFGRQAIPMTWDYPETNPFSNSTGGIKGQAEWITRVILRESNISQKSEVYNEDGAFLPTENLEVNLVTTDPPYFDAISYGDLSDFFYVWLKRILGGILDLSISTPLSPKADEATALKHRHGGHESEADKHFNLKLTQVITNSHKAIKKNGLVTIMFAHQSTKAWSSLITAILNAKLTVDATWPIDTELTSALKSKTSSLSSSVTVVCRPRIMGNGASFKDVHKEIKTIVQKSVKRFWSYGFRGADLIVACYGPAVGVFGKYERVEKGDGTVVEIPELLDLARRAARDAIAGEFKGDNLSTLYYVWANLYGSSEQAWDDARLVVQIGGESEDPMEVARGSGIFVVDGSRCRLAMLADRTDRRGLGRDMNPPLIDTLHRAMALWKGEERNTLVALWHLARHAAKLAESVHTKDLARVLEGRFPEPVRAVAVFTNETCDATQGRITPEGIHTHTLWGELAVQLGGKALYERVRANDETQRVPQGIFAELLRRAAPCLILLDELADYCVGAAAVPVGDTTLADQTVSFIQQLEEAVAQVPGAAVVATLPASKYEVAQSEKGQEAFVTLEKRFQRLGADIKPVADDEIYEVVRARLFESISLPGDPDYISKVARAYQTMYASHSGEVPLEASKGGYREQIERAFPFHPSVIDTFYTRWGSHPDFQRTRGVLKLLASIVGDLWNRRSGAAETQHLIQPCHIRWSIDALQAALTRLWGPAYQSVAAADIMGPKSIAAAFEEERGGDYGRENLGQGIASAILMGSFGGKAERTGFSTKEIKLGCSKQGINWSYTDGALLELENRCFYLHSAGAGTQGKRYWFSTKPTLNKLIIQYRQQMSGEDFENEILDDLRNQVQMASQGAATWRIVVNPAEDLPEQKALTLLILPPSLAWNGNGNGNETVKKHILKISEKCGSRDRLYRNSLIFLAGTSRGLGKLRQAYRERAAMRNVQADYWDQLDDVQKEDLQKRLKSADQSAVELLGPSYTVALRVEGEDVEVCSMADARRDWNEHLGYLWSTLVDDEEWILRRLGAVTLEKAGLLLKEGSLRLKDAVEAFLRFTDKPVISSKDAVTSGLAQACSDGLIGIGKGGSPSVLHSRKCKETIYLDPAEEGVWIIPAFEPSGSDKTAEQEKDEKTETEPDSKKEVDSGRHLDSTGQETANRIRRFRVSGSVPIENYGELFRCFVNPAARMNLKKLNLGVQFEMETLPEHPIDQNDPALKAMQEAASQLGLNFEKEE